MDKLFEIYLLELFCGSFGRKNDNFQWQGDDSGGIDKYHLWYDMEVGNWHCQDDFEHPSMISSIGGLFVIFMGMFHSENE